jgi:hypothetical protein
MNLVSRALLLFLASPRGSVGAAVRQLSVSSWNMLTMHFDPSQPDSVATISIRLQRSVALYIGNLLEISLPGFKLDESLSYNQIEFSAWNEGDALLNIFDYFAIWNPTASTITFTLAADIPQDTIMDIRSMADQFRLPSTLDENSSQITMTVLSSDGSVISPATAFFQTNPIYPKVEFTSSTLAVTGTDLTISFSVSRMVFADDVLVLQLPGYSSSVLTPAVTSSSDPDLFVDNRATFNPETFTYTLLFSRQRSFSGNSDVSFTLADVSLPAGTYDNDASLKIRILPYDFVPITKSPKLGIDKRFSFSKLSFSPLIPESVSGIDVDFQPSVDLYPGTIIAVHLRGGFIRGTPSSLVNIYGPSVESFSNIAYWNGTAVSFTVTQLVAGGSSVALSIPVSEQFILPPTLSMNDGLLLIEARDLVVIRVQAVDESPRVGSLVKRFENLSILFSPATANEITRIRVQFSCNVDLVPGSSIQIHLGGFRRNSGTIVLASWGAADWDADSQNLNLSISIVVPRNTVMDLTIDTDQQFRLPNSFLLNDKSLWISSSSMGIPRVEYIPSSERINLKGFTKSQLRYVGDSDSVSDLFFLLEPSFDILPGSVLELVLPGFRLVENSHQAAVISSLDVFAGNQGRWNGTVVSLTVGPGKYILANQEFSIEILNSQFRLPEAQSANSEFVGISVSGNQFLPFEALKVSEAIIPRRFEKSELVFGNPVPLAVSSLEFILESKVPIKTTESIQIKLPGFSRVSGSVVVETPGPAYNCAGTWDASSFILSMNFDAEISPTTELRLEIHQVSGFVLPRGILRNSPFITISVPGSIAERPLLSSPLVGDGPYANQLYCVRVYELGARVHVEPDACIQPAICTSSSWIMDACSSSELVRCGCDQFVSELDEEKSAGFSVSGFNLNESDSLFFSSDSDCMNPTAHVQVIGSPSVTSSGLFFPLVRPLAVGKYFACLVHDAKIFSAGSMTVRSVCEAPLVSFQGTCQSFCPVGYVPKFGECMHISAVHDELLAFQIALTYSSSVALWEVSDSTLDFFKFEFSENMKSVLNEKHDRFEVISVSDGSALADEGLLVTVVISPVLGSRSTSETFELLKALFLDEYSNFFSNNFFKSTIRSVEPKKRARVVFCESIGKYLATCPSSREWGSPQSAPTWYVLAVALGGAVAGLVITGTAFALYRLDSAEVRISSVFRLRPKVSGASKTNDFSVVKISAGSSEKEVTLDLSDVSSMEPGARIEFAKTWLDGQLLDEPTILKRKRK